MAILEGTRNSETLDAGAVVCLFDCPDDDTIYGYGGNDAIFGRVGNDYLYGGHGNDAIYGGQGDDHLWGEEDGSMWITGDDYLEGGSGADEIHGGDGTDTAGYIGSDAGVSVSLVTGRGSGGDAEGDTLDGIENLTGSDYDDWLAGDDGNNGILGRRGDDVVKGFGGADSLVGGSGNDLLDGGNGSDWLEGNADNDVLAGGAGADTLVGGSGRDDLYGGAGVDYLSGGGDADRFHWQQASDTGVTPATADVISDFNPVQGDRIDLSAIDADVTAAGNQAFTFIGTAAFTLNAATPDLGDVRPGEIRYYWANGNTYIQMQTGTAADVEGVICINGLYQLEAGWLSL